VLRGTEETETTQENIQDWLELDEEGPQFQFLKEEKTAAVVIATGFGLDDRGVGVRVSVESRIFTIPE
jgi:hypothetical protein